jgi:GNAT superfamily N-acetyltransferase
MEDRDEHGVIALLDEALGPAPGGVDRRSLFRWKHVDNPFGRSIALVAESDGRIVGLRTFMRWRFSGPDGEPVSAVRAVDTATSPAVRRRGVFSSLTLAALYLCEQEGVAFVFNTPNARSLPGYLKMGWRRVARWPVRLRVRRPHRLLSAAARRDLRAGPAVEPPAESPLVPAGGVLANPAVAAMVAAASLPAGRLYTPRTQDYLRWRYSKGPVPYHAVTVGDPPAVVVVVRLRARGGLREAAVCEVLSLPGAADEARRLLRGIPRYGDVDHAVAHGAPGWGDRAVAAGYRRLPGAGIEFTARPVSSVRGIEPLDRAAWSLSLGDLELF